MRMQVPALEAALAPHRDTIEDSGEGEVRVRVSTVDGFQGREADVVVFSATRNNPSRRLGFVRDVRRLNVALTRARRGLVVVAAPCMLAADPVWGECATAPPLQLTDQTYDASGGITEVLETGVVTMRVQHLKPASIACVHAALEASARLLQVAHVGGTACGSGVGGLAAITGLT